MNDRSRPFISFGTFALATSLMVVAWLAYEHFGHWWPFAIVAPLVVIVNLLGIVSPNGSVFWALREVLQDLRNKLNR